MKKLLIKDIRKNCRGAEFACEFEAQFDSAGGDHLETLESKIATWAQSVNGLLK